MDTGMGVQPLGSTQSNFFGNINTAKGSNPLANLTSGVDTLSLSGKPDVHFGHGMPGKTIEKKIAAWGKDFTQQAKNAIEHNWKGTKIQSPKGTAFFDGVVYKTREAFVAAKKAAHQAVNKGNTSLK